MTDIASVKPAGDGRWIVTTRRSPLLARNAVDRVDNQARAWSPLTMEKVLECDELFDGKAIVRGGEAMGRLNRVRRASADGMDWHLLEIDADLKAGDRYNIYDFAAGDAVMIPGIAVK